MGWTSYHATHYKRGTVDRKAECDAYFTNGLNARYYRVVKSALVGSVYYAAVQNLDVPEAERSTWAAIFLTSVDSRNYYNFAYKDMSEDAGPFECKCPASILSLLSPTASEWANDWRKRCWEQINEKKNPKALKNLPVGAVIRFKRHNGEMIELQKHPAAYQFKRPFWYNSDNNTYMPAKRIPVNYEVVSS